MTMLDWDRERAKNEDQTWGTFFDGLMIVWRMSRPQHPRLLGGFAFQILRVMLEPLTALLLTMIFGAVVLFQHNHDPRRILKFLVGLVCLKVLDVLIDQYGAARLFWEGAIRLSYIWPRDCHTQLLDLPAEFHEREGISRHISKITKGCNTLFGLTQDLFYGFMPAVVYWCMNVLILLWFDWLIAVALMVPVGLALSLNSSMRRKLTPMWERIETDSERTTKHLIQGVRGATTVQTFVQEACEKDHQQTSRADMIAEEDESLRLERPYFVGMLSALACGFVFALMVGLWRVAQGKLSPAIITYIGMTGWATMSKFWEVLNIYRRIMRNSVTIRRVEKLLAVQNSMPNNPEDQEIMSDRFELSCDDLSFKYESRDTIMVDGLSATFEAGKMHAFVGKSGAGKSTLVKLLQRVYDPTDGCIRVNGIDVREISRDWYRSQFAVVAQSPFIFDKSIKENVRYGVPSASDDEVREALHAAHLTVVLEDADRFPKGMEEEAGENGVSLSGGEGQRVGIARAYLKLIRGARVLVLDEATSSLDSEAEDAIRAMIERLRRQGVLITIFVIAHRLSTIKGADRIYVMEDGDIIEQGTHTELVRLQGRYANLVARQNLHV